MNSNGVYARGTTHPSSQYLVDGRRLLEGALRDHLRPHLLHVQHEGIQRLLDVRLLVLFLTIRTVRLFIRHATTTRALVL